VNVKVRAGLRGRRGGGDSPVAQSPRPERQMCAHRPGSGFLLAKRQASAFIVLVLGYAAGFFLASAGPVSLFPALVGLGGVVASALYGR